jgi:hypothetical protein
LTEVVSDVPRDQDANATSGVPPTPSRPDDGSGASGPPAAGATAAAPPGGAPATGRARAPEAGTGQARAGAAGPGTTGPGTTGPGTTGPGTTGPGTTGPGTTGPGTTGPGTAGTGSADTSPAGPRAAGTSPAGPTATGSTARPGGSRADRIAGAAADADSERRRRRRQRLLVGGIAAGAAALVILLCAGLLVAAEAVGDYRDDTGEARERRARHDADCLTLEERLNRLMPPGATTTPQARATAVRDENAAVRIYVDSLTGRRGQDEWRQLLDARTAYAEALDRQARARTPAFFVAPRGGDGRDVADELIDTSPASCAGPVRRLAAPDI